MPTFVDQFYLEANSFAECIDKVKEIMVEMEQEFDFVLFAINVHHREFSIQMSYYGSWLWLVRIRFKYYANDINLAADVSL